MSFSNTQDEQPRRKAANSPRRTRISKEPEERRQEIIETALTLFSEKGYENTTIQDISDRMNVSPGLFYRYFKSKTEIFAATSEYYAMKAVEQLKVPTSQDTPAPQKLSLFLQQIFAYVMKHKELDHVANEMAEVMIPIIEQGIAENVFHCKDARRTAKFLVFGLIHTFHDDLPDNNTEDYIILFRDFMREVFSNILKIENWE